MSKKLRGILTVGKGEKGDKGDIGPQGPPGPVGPMGPAGSSIAFVKILSSDIDYEDWLEYAFRGDFNIPRREIEGDVDQLKEGDRIIAMGKARNRNNQDVKVLFEVKRQNPEYWTFVGRGMSNLVDAHTRDEVNKEIKHVEESIESLGNHVDQEVHRLDDRINKIPGGGGGQPGPPGPEGPRGPEGPQGPAGPKGEKGRKGEPGPPGPQGAIGPQGQQGEAGPQGVPGKDGAAGPVGPTGPQGLTGREGPMGPPGPRGPEGVVDPNKFMCSPGYDKDTPQIDVEIADTESGIALKNGFYKTSNSKSTRGLPPGIDGYARDGILKTTVRSNDLLIQEWSSARNSAKGKYIRNKDGLNKWSDWEKLAIDKDVMNKPNAIANSADRFCPKGGGHTRTNEQTEGLPDGAKTYGLLTYLSHNDGDNPASAKDSQSGIQIFYVSSSGEKKGRIFTRIRNNSTWDTAGWTEMATKDRSVTSSTKRAKRARDINEQIIKNADVLNTITAYTNTSKDVTTSGMDGIPHEERDGVLFFVPEKDKVGIQHFYSSHEKGTMYTRRVIDTNKWTPWKRILNQDDIRNSSLEIKQLVNNNVDETKESGFYRTNGSTVGTLPDNFTSQNTLREGVLEVLKTDNQFISQKWHTLRGQNNYWQNNVYTRAYDHGQWSKWERLLTKEDTLIRENDYTGNLIDFRPKGGGYGRFSVNTNNRPPGCDWGTLLFLSENDGSGPFAQAGILMLMCDGGSEQGNTFTRVLENNNWQNWKKLMTDQNTYDRNTIDRKLEGKVDRNMFQLFPNSNISRGDIQIPLNAGGKLVVLWEEINQDFGWGGNNFRIHLPLKDVMDEIYTVQATPRENTEGNHWNFPVFQIGLLQDRMVEIRSNQGGRNRFHLLVIGRKG